MFENLKNILSLKQKEYKDNVLDSQHYQENLKYLNDITFDLVNTLYCITLYSTRAGTLYNDFFTISFFDDIIQSAIGIKFLVENGNHNTAKRELGYLIEMMTKYALVDQIKMGEKIEVKKAYFHSEIPNSSIDMISEYTTPFNTDQANSFRTEVKDYFIKACAYVHPSKKQIEEQLANAKNGTTIGFETSKMLADMNSLIFRAYDMLLVMNLSWLWRIYVWRCFYSSFR